MTIDVLIIRFYKTTAFFTDYSILPYSCCLCTNICYVKVKVLPITGHEDP